MLPANRDATTQADLDAISSAFDLVKANTYWELYRRAPARILPPPTTTTTPPPTNEAPTTTVA